MREGLLSMTPVSISLHRFLNLNHKIANKQKQIDWEKIINQVAIDELTYEPSPSGVGVKVGLINIITHIWIIKYCGFLCESRPMQD